MPNGIARPRHISSSCEVLIVDCSKPTELILYSEGEDLKYKAQTKLFRVFIELIAIALLYRGMVYIRVCSTLLECITRGCLLLTAPPRPPVSRSAP